MLFRNIVVLLFLFLFFASANADELRILRNGDVIDADFGQRLSVLELRKILRDYGYHGLGPGGVYGQILHITAYAHNKKRYVLKIHSLSGEVIKAYKTRNYTV